MNTNVKVALVFSGAIVLIVIAFIVVAILQAQPPSPETEGSPAPTVAGPPPTRPLESSCRGWPDT